MKWHRVLFHFLLGNSTQWSPNKLTPFVIWGVGRGVTTRKVCGSVFACSRQASSINSQSAVPGAMSPVPVTDKACIHCPCLCKCRGLVTPGHAACCFLVHARMVSPLPHPGWPVTYLCRLDLVTSRRRCEMKLTEPRSKKCSEETPQENGAAC